jgi:hypothetical protein
LRTVELRQRADVYRPVRTSCVTSADDSLTMIMLSTSLRAAPGGALLRGHPGVLIGRSLGYEVNGTRPMPPIGSCLARADRPRGRGVMLTNGQVKFLPGSLGLCSGHAVGYCAHRNHSDGSLGFRLLMAQAFNRTDV